MSQLSTVTASLPCSCAVRYTWRVRIATVLATTRITTSRATGCRSLTGRLCRSIHLDIRQSIPATPIIQLGFRHRNLHTDSLRNSLRKYEVGDGQQFPPNIRIRQASNKLVSYLTVDNSINRGVHKITRLCECSKGGSMRVSVSEEDCRRWRKRWRSTVGLTLGLKYSLRASQTTV